MRPRTDFQNPLGVTLGVTPDEPFAREGEMISVSQAQANLLAFGGLAFDIIGALILSRALMWARPQALAKQTEARWVGNPDLLRALCEQTTDAVWGSIFLTLGFALQALSSLGINIELTILAALGGLLIVAVSTYLGTRKLSIKSRYMRAVEALNGDADDKEAMRRLF